MTSEKKEYNKHIAVLFDEGTSLESRCFPNNFFFFLTSERLNYKLFSFPGHFQNGNVFILHLHRHRLRKVQVP